MTSHATLRMYVRIRPVSHFLCMWYCACELATAALQQLLSQPLHAGLRVQGITRLYTCAI